MKRTEAERRARMIEAEAYYECAVQAKTPAGWLSYHEANESWHIDGQPITREQAVEILTF
jgi:hypothetical protein